MDTERDPAPAATTAIGLNAVIFDLFGVLTDVQSPTGVNAMMRRLRVDGSVFRTAYWADRPDYDRGVLSGPEYWARVARSLGRSLDDGEIAELIGLDVGSWDHPEPSMIEFAGAVGRSGLAVAILSNSPQEFTERFRSYPWMARFDLLVFSSDVGVVKPEPAIFAKVIAGLKVDPGSAVLIDDTTENVDAARSQGIRGFVFRTGSTTPAELAALIDLGETHAAGDPIPR